MVTVTTKLLLLLLAVLFGCVIPQDDFPLLLSDKFRATSNSTCDQGNCSSPAQHQPSAVFDGNVLSWWESKEIQTPVLLSLSSSVSLLGFSLSINLRFQNNSLPQVIGIYSQSNQKLYAINCSSVVSESCHELLLVTQQSSHVVYVHLTLNGSGYGFDIVFTGFGGLSKHYEIQEIAIYGTVDEGYYLPGLHGVLMEAENGALMNSSDNLDVGFNFTMFPNFSGQGYVVLTALDKLLLMLEIKHATSVDNLFLHYVNSGSQNFSVSAMVMQENLSCNVLFTCNICLGDCFSRAQSNCSNDTLSTGIVTVIVGASGNNLLLDYVSAVPNAFQEIIDMCEVVNNLNKNCTHLALQQSLDLYLSLQDCQCSHVYSNGSVCELYDGQCPCLEIGGQIGRQCNDCLFSYYLNDTLGRCIACECPDGASCSNTGQCHCKQCVGGLKCDTCDIGCYGASPNCFQCNCNMTGTLACNLDNGNCSCKPNVQGERCSECGMGFYNFSESGCQPCSCYQGGGSCDSSGVCICNEGYSGSACDECEIGFVFINGSCTACNCSERTNSCISVSGRIHCICPAEYSGDYCEFCTNDHYLSNNNSCVPCNCSDSALFCRNTTGECVNILLPPPPVPFPPQLNCSFNTTGELCQFCANGFYNSSINSDLMCTPCPCDISSSNGSCQLVDTNPICFCNLGFTGNLCNSCSIGYFGPNCQNCECGIGAVNTSCDETTGQCYCSNHVEGYKCDTCVKYHYLLSSNSGCVECDSCVQSLRRQAATFVAEITTVDTITLKARDFQTADTLDLLVLQSRVNMLQSTCNITLINIMKDRMNFTDITRSVTDIQFDLTDLRNLIDTLLINATRTLPNAELIFNQVTDFHNSLGDTVEVDYTMTFVNGLDARIRKLVNDSIIVLLSVNSSINDLQQEFLTNSTDNIQQYVQNVSFIDNFVTLLLHQTLNESSKIATEQMNANLISTELTDLQARISSFFTTIQTIDVVGLEYRYTNASVTIGNITNLINQSIFLINQSDANLDYAKEVLSMISSDMHYLQSILTDNIILSGSGSGSGNVMNQQSIAEQIMSLNTSVQQLKENLHVSTVLYKNALKHANNTLMQEQVVCSIINASLYTGNIAVDAIMNYTFVSDTLTLASHLITLTNTTLVNTLYELELLINNDLGANVTKGIETALRLATYIDDLNKKITNFKTWHDILAEVLIEESNNLSDLIEAIDLLMKQYFNMQANTTIASGLIATEVSGALYNSHVANSTYTNMFSTYLNLMENISELSRELNELAVNNTGINDNAVVANDTASDAQEDFNEKFYYLDLINSERTQLVNEIDTAKLAMLDLQQQLVEAQEAAALVDIALMFYGNGTSSYNLSFSTQEDTHISLYFRPDSYSGVILSDMRDNTIQLENGQIKWISGNQELITQNFNLYLNEWYQVEASTNDTALFLSVAPLQEPGDSTVTVLMDVNISFFPINSYVVLAGDDDSYYSGCIDRVIVNGERLPLLLPNATSLNVVACGPRPAVELLRSLESNAWFQGQSRLSLPLVYFIDGIFTFSFDFRTFSQSSQLAMILNSAMAQSIVVYINDSVIHLQVSLGIDIQTLSSFTKVNDGAWYSVSVSIEELEVALAVNQETVTTTLGVFAQNLSSPVNITLGGFSDMNIPSFSGCLANFSVEETNVDLSMSQAVERVEISECPSSVSPGIRFMGTGLATFPMASFVNSVSFSFRTKHLSSVLLMLSSIGMLPDRLIVTLFHTYLRVEMINSFHDITLISSQMNLNNGQWHDVSISLVQDRLVLSVDGVTNSAIIMNNTNFLLIMGDVSVGGLPNQWSIQELVMDNYRGCFDNLYINREYYDFNKAVLSDGVALFGCHDEISLGSGSGTSSMSLFPSSTVFIESTSTLPPYTEPPDILPSTIFEYKPSSNQQSSSVPGYIPSSTVPKLEPSSTPSSTILESSSTIPEPSFTFLESSSTISEPSFTISEPQPSSTPTLSAVGLNGHQGSFLSYSTPDITYYFTITLTFRTGSSNALLLYSQDNSLVDYMALELRNGQLYYSFNLGGGAVFINPIPPLNRYDDNMNHTVTITRNGTIGYLIINGVEYSGLSVNSHTQLNTNRNPIHVGGVPKLSTVNLFRDQSQVPPGAFACFYNLKVNDKTIDLSAPLAANGMVSCQDSYNDYVSFPGSGYARLVDIYTPLVAYGFRLDFRTVHCTGLILYSSNLYLDDHTALEINGGKIRFIFDNGHGAGIVEYIPANISSLCDGNWHHIQATKNGVTGSLVIDEQAPITSTLPSTGFISTDTYSPLYAGGVPDDVLVRYTVTSEFFQGCLNNVQLIDSNQGRNMISNVHFSDVFVSHTVELNRCHL